MSVIQKLNSQNETTWMQIGKLAESMNDMEKALFSYENALRYNNFNINALRKIASIYRSKDQFSKAVEYYQRVLSVETNNPEIWGALGHCFLMMDDLQKAYAAYHQALYNSKVQNTKQDPHLWYGIGILYERYGSLENAEEAFTSVLKKDPNFEKSNEIYFRLGIVYKQQMKFEQSLECFGYILNHPPAPLTEGDIWFQIGHVYELKKDFVQAKKSYERVLQHNANHAKVLQQLGWLYHQNTPFMNQDIAISYLRRSIDADPNDGQTWYLLGRCYMAQQKYRLAYDAYQQAVFRDGRNPTFWCSIGVLYYQINQYRDALDAYSRAIRLNPYLSEVWYDLGTLYESCNQISDALDAYSRAAELDPHNKHIQQRLTMLRSQSGIPIKQVTMKQMEQNRQQIPQGQTTLAPLSNVSSVDGRNMMQNSVGYGRNEQLSAPVPIQPKSGAIAPSFQELTRTNAQMKKNAPPPQSSSFTINTQMQQQQGNNVSSLANLNRANRPNLNPASNRSGILNPTPHQAPSLSVITNDFKQYQFENEQQQNENKPQQFSQQPETIPEEIDKPESLKRPLSDDTEGNKSKRVKLNSEERYHEEPQQPPQLSQPQQVQQPQQPQQVQQAQQPQRPQQPQQPQQPEQPEQQEQPDQPKDAEPIRSEKKVDQPKEPEQPKEEKLEEKQPEEQEEEMVIHEEPETVNTPKSSEHRSPFQNILNPTNTDDEVQQPPESKESENKQESKEEKKPESVEK